MLTQMDQILENAFPIGELVEDSAGQPIGRISNVLFDRRTAEATHVIVSLKGILGLENKEVAIRQEALAPSQKPGRRDHVGPYSIDLDREQMRFPETVNLLLI
jgi:hypothetical protein